MQGNIWDLASDTLGLGLDPDTDKCLALDSYINPLCLGFLICEMGTRISILFKKVSELDVRKIFSILLKEATWLGSTNE